MKIFQQEIEFVNALPKKYGIEPIVNGNTIELTISKPSQFVVEVNGYHNVFDKLFGIGLGGKRRQAGIQMSLV